MLGDQTATAAVFFAASVPVVLLVVGKLWTRLRSSHSPYPPGPKQHWLLGNVKDLPDPAESTIDVKLLEWSKQYGLYFSMAIPLLGKIVVISDPALFKRVTVTMNRPKSPSYKVFTSVVGKRSMLVLSGQDWTRHRKGFNPAFGTSFVRSMVPIMTDKLGRFLTCLDEDARDGATTVLLQRSLTFTSDVIAGVAFGEDWGGGRDVHPARFLLNEMAEILEGVLLKPLQRLLGLVGLGPMSQLRRYSKLLDNEMRAVLERRLSSGDGLSSENAKDICSLAIKTIRGERKRGELSEDDKQSIVDQLKTFYFAGHDTTSSLITWSVWLLSQHKEVLEKVRVELGEHCVWTNPDAPNPSYEDLQKLTYLEAMLKETLRLYPPAGIVSRWGDDLDETYEGYRIGGAVQMLAIYTMHHNPALWNDPEAFRPERFLDGSEEGLADKFAPFSRGPRDCIGRHFAMLEAKLALSALVSRYDFECINPHEGLVQRITYVPRQGGLVKFHRR
jgi:cytochrome P450